MAESVREVELRIAKAGTDGFEAQKKVLSEQIAEAENGFILLNQLLENVNGAIELGRADLDRAEELRKKGLNRQMDVSSLQGALSGVEARQLEVLTNISQARKDMGLLKSRLRPSFAGTSSRRSGRASDAQCQFSHLPCRAPDSGGTARFDCEPDCRRIGQEQRGRIRLYDPARYRRGRNRNAGDCDKHPGACRCARGQNS